MSVSAARKSKNKYARCGSAVALLTFSDWAVSLAPEEVCYANDDVVRRALRGRASLMWANLPTCTNSGASALGRREAMMSGASDAKKRLCRQGSMPSPNYALATFSIGNNVFTTECLLKGRCDTSATDDSVGGIKCIDSKASAIWI